MGRNQYLFLGLAVVLTGLSVVGGMLWVKLDKNQAQQQQKTPIKVISWQPESATLVYQDDQGQQQQVVIQPLKPVVVVPVYEEGKFVKEELTLTNGALRWRTAFCSGDELELTVGEDGELKTIRNRGLRLCEK